MPRPPYDPPADLTRASTLIAVLLRRVQELPGETAFVHLDDAGRETRMSYRDLGVRVGSIAHSLRGAGLTGSRVVLALPPGLDFAPAFFGCLAAGVIAAPAAPFDPSRPNRSRARLRSIIDDAEPSAVLTTSASPLPDSLDMARIDLDALMLEAAPPVLDLPGPDDVAYLQYTSGSTSDPKGVVLTHGNLWWNCFENHLAYGIDRRSTMVCWVPAYHDMGLLYAIASPIFGGARCVTLAARAFVQRPIRWLRAISKYGATHSVAPNTAYDLAARRTTPAERTGLDLSRWRMALNGAEPIRAETERRFMDAFGPHGLKVETLSHALGMAEGTGKVTAEWRDERGIFATLDPAALRRGTVRDTDPASPHIAVASCGRPSPHTEVFAVDPDRRARLPDDRIGELWVHGPSVGQGYFRQPEASAATFGAHLVDDDRGPWLRTGDLGFVRAGRVYVTGRMKDLIIVRGLNHHPQDIEGSLDGAHPALRPGRAVAVGVPGPDGEALAIIAEVRPDRLGEAEAVFAAIRARIVEHGVRAHTVLLCPPGTVQKTTSGKPRRRWMRDRLMDGAVSYLHRWDAPAADDARRGAPPEDRQQRTFALVRRTISDLTGEPLPAISAHRSLAELGLDSLMAVEVSTRLGAALGASLPPSIALQAADPAGLAAAIDGLIGADRADPGSGHGMDTAHTLDSASEASPRAGSLPSARRPYLAPLSESQARLHALHATLERPETYNVQLTLHVQRALDPTALRAALEVVFARHEQLRMHVVDGPGGPRQRILPWVEVPLEVISVGSIPADEQAETLRRLAHERAAVPFDLSRPPLMRVTLVEFGPRASGLHCVWHHIATDGWSAGVMRRGLEQAYDDPDANDAPAPTHAALVRRMALTDAERDRYHAWWTAHLADVEPLDLPTDRPRSTRPRGGDLVEPALPAGIAAGVDALAIAAATTPFSVILTAWAAVLQDLTDQLELPVGIVTSGRTVAGAADAVGFFARTLPLVCRLAGGRPVRAVVAAVGAAVRGALDHQHLPLADMLGIRSSSAPSGQPDRAPGLLRAIFVQESAGWFGERFAGAPCRVLDRAVSGDVEGTAKFELALAVVRTVDGYRASIEFATHLFDRSTVVLLGARLGHVLAAMVEQHDVLWSRLDRRPPTERAQVARWGAAEPAAPFIEPVTDAIIREAMRAPTSVAVRHGDVTLTRDALVARARALAARLRTRGVGPEARVGICVPRSVDSVVAMLGVWLAGGAWVPLDPSLPADRLGFIARDSGIRWVVAAEPTALVEAWSADVVPIESAAAGATVADPRVDPDQLAYIIYTSGSTGTPKGVAISHRGLPPLVAARRRWQPHGPGIAVLCVAAFSFDAAVSDLCFALATGATLVIATETERTSGPALQAALRRVDAAVLPPAVLPDLDPAALPADLSLAIAGERCPPAEAERWTRQRPLLNFYGPTEATVWSTAARIVRAAPVLPIGRPVAGMRVRVVDRWGALAGIGTPGELCLSGPGLARGYVGRPAATAERFRPGGEVPGARWYRTGDRVRWRADGELEFLGRLDRQLKIRGFRIEPAEIEAALVEHPGVTAAVVAASPAADGQGGYGLVAWFVSRADRSPPPTDALRRHLAGALPDHMIPAAFVSLPALPLTDRGKIDHGALPAPRRAHRAIGHTLPATPTEARLCRIWADVLGVDGVGVTDDFYGLGGHSLRVTRVASRIAAAFGVGVPLRALFDARTPRAQAALVEHARGRPAPPSIGRVSREGRLIASPGQARLWLLERLGSGADYVLPIALKLRGALNRPALAAALSWLVQRHEALRMTLASDGEGVHVRLGDGDAALAAIRRSVLAEPTEVLPGRALHAALAAELDRPFDLAAGPLVRARLSSIADPAEPAHALLLTLHHAIADGWSVGLLLGELAEAYAAFADGGAPLHSTPQIDYVDFAAWQHGRLAGGLLDEQLGWWREALRDAPPLALPIDRPRPGVRPTRGASRAFSFDQATSAALGALTERFDVTPFMALLAGYALVLSRLSGQTDVLVGSPVAGRDDPAIEETVGFFVNTLALRVDVAGDPTVEALFGRVRDATIDAFAHRDAPFDQVVDAVGARRDAARPPLCQVMLVVQNAPIGVRPLGAVLVERLELASTRARFELTLSVEVEPDGRVHGLAEYAADLFEPATIDRWIESLGATLRRMAASPGDRLSSIDTRSAEERAALERFAEPTAPTGTPDGQRADLLSVIAERAELDPAGAAVVFGGHILTRSALQARIAAMASTLRQVGVGPEVRVVVCLPRSPDAVVAILAVLAAGGAYVPLSPDWPAARLRQMTADVGAARVVIDAASTVDWPVPVTPIEAPTTDGASAALALPLDPDHLAYVIHTSGSTGRPKGVAVSHRALATTVHTEIAVLALGPGRAALHAIDLTFDPSVPLLLAPLVAGATLVLAGADALRDPRALSRCALEGRVDAISLTPGVCAGLSDAVFEQAEVIMLGGETCPPPLAARITAHARLVIAYGPTEATVAAAYRTGDGTAEPEDPRAVGHTAPGRRLYVLGAGLEHAPLGAPGEIYIGGIGLARGYVGQPAGTADRFIPDPYGPPGSRMYRTGDRARWRSDGQLVFLGRTDRQIKLRGLRIEPGEIEAALRSDPRVTDALVIGRTSGPEQRLVAYVTGDGGPDAEVRRRLRERLPAQWIPATLVWMHAFPLTAGGKIDHARLPETAAVADARLVAPRTPVEAALAAIWQTVLEQPVVGVHDDFFALGGHSLKVAQVAGRVADTLGVELPLRAYFEATTVAALAERLQRAEGRTEPAIGSTPRPERLPLSSAQARLYVLDRLAPATAEYNIPVALRLRGPLDVEALSRTLTWIVARHEALRTTVAVDLDGPYAHIAEPGPVPLHLEPVADQDALTPRLARFASAAFDLAAGPLIRARGWRLADDDHVLAVVIHHFAFDGWSAGVLFDELADGYAAFADGHGPPIGPLAVQAVDHAIWQRARLDGDALTGLLDHWRRALAGAPALDLPTDHPRPATRSIRGASLPIDFGPETAAAVGSAARRAGVTPFMVLTAGLAIVLGRSAGQRDIVIGTPVAGRDRPSLEGLIGNFVNTIALRVDLDGGPTVDDLLAAVRRRTLDAYAHQEAPFEAVVDALGVPRDTSRTPVVQVMLALQNAPRALRPLGPLAVEPLTVPSTVARLDLTISLEQTPGGLRGGVEFAVDLFEVGTVRRWIDQLGRVLHAMGDRPDTPIDDLDLLGEADRRWLSARNDTAMRWPTMSLPALIAEQVARSPEATALTWEGGALTYAALWTRVTRFAHRLRAGGVGPGVPVAVSVPRSPELVIALHGVALAGGFYVPVDPCQPAPRIAEMWADCGAALVVAPATALLPAGGPPRIAVHDCRFALPPCEAAPTDLFSRGPAPDDPLYAIYTSGSTGRPKAALNAHRALVNRLLWMQSVMPIGADDVVLQKTPSSFDVSVWEFFWPLLVGARLHVARPDGHRDPTYLASLIAEIGVTTVHFVPSMLAAFLEARPEPCPRLRRVVCSGEALAADLRDALFSWSDADLFNLYGPTEAAVDVTWWRCSRVAPQPVVPIGRPISNTRTYVLDPHGRPCPIGVPGELYLAGVQVGQGYLGRPALTAERFVPDPWGAPGSRMYRTGDRCRWRADGVLDFLGRLDFQIKVRGVRVEPGEIEAVLRRMDGASNCVVVARPDTSGAARLVAYLTGRRRPLAAVRAHLAGSLPEHMVPEAFVWLDVLPTTASGKIDRKALPEPTVDRSALSATFVAPRTTTEAALADIWTDVLGLEAVGVDDDFFELGGQSLRATQVATRIADRLGVELPLRILFEATTVAALAERIDAASPTAEAAIQRVDRGERHPPSFGQARLWRFARSGPSSGEYNIPLGLWLYGRLDVSALEAALRWLVERHEALRTTLPTVDGAPYQHIGRADAFSLTVEVVPDADAVARRVAEEAWRPFDLEEGPVFRCHLWAVSPTLHGLMLNVHHVAFDAWSTRLLFAELGHAYAAFAGDDRPTLPAPPIQYVDFAVWQRAWLSGPRLARLLDWWCDRLADAPVLSLPTDHPRPATRSTRGDRVPLTIGRDLTERASALAQTRGVTPFMALLTAYAATLSRASGQDDVVIGVPVANRNRRAVEPLIGFVTNIIAVRVDLSGDPTVVTLLDRVRRALVEAYAHQDAPLGAVVEALALPPDPSRSPIFQAMFVLGDETSSPPPLGAVRTAPLLAHSEIAKFEVRLFVERTGQGLGGGLEYCADLFSRRRAQGLLAAFEHMLDAMTMAPDRRFGALLDGEADADGTTPDGDAPRERKES